MNQGHPRDDSGPAPMWPPRRGNTVRRMTDAFLQRPEALTPVLVVEIECYLDAVALFRREGCEPHWRSCDDPGASGGLCQPARKRIIDATKSGGRS